VQQIRCSVDSWHREAVKFPSSIRPENLVLSACYRENGRIFVRVYGTTGEPASLRMSSPFEVSSAAAVDFHGTRLDQIEVTTDGTTVCAPMGPWQILTLELTPK